MAKMRVVTFTILCSEDGKDEQAMTVDVHFEGKINLGLALTKAAMAIQAGVGECVKGKVDGVVVAR